jgi:hypothetical protein
MTLIEVQARGAHCQQHQLCFISLQLIDCGLPVARMWHFGLNRYVRVLRQYVKEKVLSE